MFKLNRKMVLVGAVFILVAGSTALESAQDFHTGELQPAEPHAAQTSWDAVALGRVEPQSREIKIAAAVPAPIADVLVKANEKIFAGELLIRLDDEEALARVAAQEAQVALDKRARDDQSASTAASHRRKAEDSVADAEQSVADARSTLDKVTAEWQAGHTPQADLDAARSVLSQAQERLKEQRLDLAKLKASPDTPLPTRVEGELNVARAELTLAQAAFERTRVRAPIDGTVLQVDARTGELAGPSLEQPMLVLGDVSALRVRAEVEAQYLGQLHVGQLVKVRAAAFPGREFAGKVSWIAPIVGQGRINSRSPRSFNDVDVVEVLVDMPASGPLVVGEQVDVYFSSEQTAAQ